MLKINSRPLNFLLKRDAIPGSGHNVEKCTDNRDEYRIPKIFGNGTREFGHDVEQVRIVLKVGFSTIRFGGKARALSSLERVAECQTSGKPMKIPTGSEGREQKKVAAETPVNPYLNNFLFFLIWCPAYLFDGFLLKKVRKFKFALGCIG